MPDSAIELADFADRLEEVLEATGGTAVLRRLILEAAVSGRLPYPLLHEEDAEDRPVEGISKVKAAKAGRSKGSSSKPNVFPVGELSELPEGWKWAALGDVVENLDAHRVPLSRAVRENRRGEFDYYGASGVIDRVDDYLFDGPLLLIAEDGANLKSRSTPVAFIASGRYWVNNHAHVLDAPSLHTLRYLAIAVNATDLGPYVTGTAQPKLNQARLNRIPVPIPPLAEQKRIADFVDALFALLDRADADLREMRAARTTFSATALAKLGQDLDGAAVESLTELVRDAADVRSLEHAIIAAAAAGRFKLSNGGRSPAAVQTEVFHNAPLVGLLGAHPSWDRKPLGSLGKILNGCAFPSANFSESEGLPLIRIRDIFKTDTQVKYKGDFDEKYLVGKGDILVGMDGNFNVARWRGPEALLNQRVCKLILDERQILPEFVLYFLPGYLQAIHDETSSTTVTHLSSKTIASIPFPVPPLLDQRAIVEKLDELMALTQSARQVLQGSLP